MYIIGKALMRKFNDGSQGQNGLRKTGKEKTPLFSHLETSALEDYVAVVEMEGKEAEVHRVHQNDAFLVDSRTVRNEQTLKYA